MRRKQFFSWRNSLQRALYRQITFLPKRLVLVTLLLLTLYLGLLVRTDQKMRQGALGFVEASLQSKLVADYAPITEPPTPFAPLRLEILRAKLQDENPNWSEAQIEAALQVALSAAVAPILPATPTPHPTTQMVVQATVVVNGQLVWRQPTAALLVRSTGAQRPLSKATITTPAVLAVQMSSPVTPSSLNQPVALALADGSLSQPSGGSVALNGATPTVAPGEMSLLAMASATMTDTPPPTAAVAKGPGSGALPGTATGTAPSALASPVPATPVPTTNSTPTNLPITRLAASQPGDDEAAISTIAPTAAWSWVMPTPTPLPATGTPPPTPTNAAPPPLPTANQAAPTNVPTATATVTLLIVAPAPPTTAPTATPSLAATVTSLPSPTTTASPTPTVSPTVSPTISPPPTDAPTPTLSPTPTLLPTIDGLTARLEEDKVILGWEAMGDGIVGYHLYRGEGEIGAPGERRNATLLGQPTYVDTVPLDGRSYLYYVTVTDQQNRESPPGQAIVVTVADRTPPRTPGLLSLHLSGNAIVIRWQANPEADLAGYRLYRSTSWPVDRSLGPLHGATLLTTPTYVDQVVLNGQTYHYVFTAVDQAGNESRPSIDAQMPTIDLTPPATPVGLTATAQPTGVELTWQANSDSDLAGYRLYRARTLPVDTTGPPIHNQPLLTTPFYRDETVETGQSYYYAVVAVDGNQNGSSVSEAVLVVAE